MPWVAAHSGVMCLAEPCWWPALAACVLHVQEQELRECTFKPATTPVPAYVSELVDVG
jgi:hypothetical protein